MFRWGFGGYGRLVLVLALVLFLILPNYSQWIGDGLSKDLYIYIYRIYVEMYTFFLLEYVKMCTFE